MQLILISSGEEQERKNKHVLLSMITGRGGTEQKELEYNKT